MKDAITAEDIIKLKVALQKAYSPKLAWKMNRRASIKLARLREYQIMLLKRLMSVIQNLANNKKY